MKSEEITNDLATRSEAARYLRTSELALRKWEQKRQGPPVVRLSPRRALYRWSDLRTYLEAHVSPCAPLACRP